MVEEPRADDEACRMCHGARVTSTGEPCPDCPDVPPSAKRVQKMHTLPNGRTVEEDRAWAYEALAAQTAATNQARAERDALAEAARWFMERAVEWLHDPAGQPLDPRHITHAAALFEKALTATPEQAAGGVQEPR